MRSAERLVAPRARMTPLGAGIVLALVVALSGCDTLGVHFRSANSDDAAAVPSPAASAAPAASAPASAAKPAPKPVSTAPIPPATHRAYDAAVASLRANRVADAERGFRALAQSDPELAGPHANLGIILRQAGRLPEAVTELERATDLDAQQPVTWNQLGITYRQSGLFPKARDAYDRAIALDPNYATAVLNLGVLNDLYLGDSGRALELYTRYLALTPAGDAMVAKWVVDLKNRKPAAATTPAAAPAPVPAPAPAAAKKEKS